MAKQELKAIIGADARQFMRTMAKVKAAALESVKWLGGAAVIGAAAYGAAVKTTADELDRLAKLAARTGLDTDFLQRLAHAADLSDVSMENLQAGMKSLAKATDDARLAGSPTAEAFRRLGISMADMKAGTQAERLTMVMAALSGVEDAARRSAIAQQLLGKGADAMLPMMADGAAGLEELLAERDKIGPLFTAEQIAGAEAFNDSLTALGRAAKVGLGQLAATQFGPLTERIQATTVAITRFVRSAEFGRLQSAVGTTAKLAGDLAAQFAGMKGGNLPPIAQMVENINQAMQDMSESGSMDDLREGLQGFVYLGQTLAAVLGVLFKAGKWVGMNIDDYAQGLEDQNRIKAEAGGTRASKARQFAAMDRPTMAGGAMNAMAGKSLQPALVIADLMDSDTRAQSWQTDVKPFLARTAEAVETLASKVM